MKKYLPFHLLNIVVFLLLAQSGCSPLTSLEKKIRGPSGNGLRHRVMVLPILNQAGFPPKTVKNMESQFGRFLRRDGHILLVEPSLPPSLTSGKGPSGLATDIDPLVIREAGSAGADVLLSLIFHPMEVTTRKAGIWPVLLTRKELVISMSLSALDITSKTLLVSNIESASIRVQEPMEQFTLFVEGAPEGNTEDEVEDPLSYADEKSLEKGLDKILKRQASITSERLKDTPWTGTILSVENNSIVINGGRDVRVLPGHIFEVFEKRETIRAASGSTYRIMGEKIGEIEVVSSTEHKAVASPLAGAGFSPGQGIRLKSGL